MTRLVIMAICSVNPKVYIVPDASLPPLPKRSRLFGLHPEGTGTARCESLIAHVVRLARTHMVSPRTLVQAEFLPRCRRHGSYNRAGFFGVYGRTVNGLGPYAEDFALVTEELTCRNGMEHLTMLPWQGIIPSIGTGLLAKRVQWCKACLVEHRHLGEYHGFPLVWSLDLYRVCHKHGTPLSSSCPWCGKAQPFFPYVPDQSRCDSCGGWLGSVAATDKPYPNLAVMEEDWWLATALAEMVAGNPYAKALASPENLRHILTRLVEEHAEGDRKRFSGMMGLSPTTMSCWLAKGKKPQFPQFIQICHRLDVTPVALLSREHKLTDIKTPTSRQKLLCIEQRRKINQEEHIRIRKMLERIVMDPSDVRTLSQMAEALGVSRTFLKYHFPELCAKAVEKRRSQVHEIHCVGEESNKAIVRNAVLALHMKGINPSRRKVDQVILASKLSLAQSELSAVYRQAVDDLRLEK